MSRIEAWNFMKKLNDGTATLVVRQKIENNENHHEKKVPPPVLALLTNMGLHFSDPL